MEPREAVGYNLFPIHGLSVGFIDEENGFGAWLSSTPRSSSTTVRDVLTPLGFWGDAMLTSLVLSDRAAATRSTLS